MNLKKLSHDDLRLFSRKAAHAIKASESNFLLFIQEVDRRAVFKKWGCESLFEWIEKDCDLCDGSSHLRITAARMLNEFPQIAQKIDEGKLSLSTIALAQTFFNENKISDSQTKAQILMAIEGLSKRKTIQKLFAISGKRKAVNEGIEPASADTYKVTFELREETIGAMKEVLGLTHKKLSYDELLYLAFTALKKDITKKIFKTDLTPRASKGTNIHGRTFSNQSIRTAAERSRGKCEICGSRNKPQKDHIKPYSMGGLSISGNCRILCRTCNRHEAFERGILLHPDEVRRYKKSD